MTGVERLALHDGPALARAAAQRLFDQIAPELAAALPASAELRHIGATAIEGCLTKGDLDIVVRVAPDDLAAADAALAARFPRNDGSVRTDGFSAFEDPSQQPHLGVQLVAVGDPLDVFHRFVDALRDRPDLIEAYNALKRRFDGASMAEYRASKNAFIESVLRDAGASG